MSSYRLYSDISIVEGGRARGVLLMGHCRHCNEYATRKLCSRWTRSKYHFVRGGRREGQQTQGRAGWRRGGHGWIPIILLGAGHPVSLTLTPHCGLFEVKWMICHSLSLWGICIVDDLRYPTTAVVHCYCSMNPSVQYLVREVFSSRGGGSRARDSAAVAQFQGTPGGERHQSAGPGTPGHH